MCCKDSMRHPSSVQRRRWQALGDIGRDAFRMQINCCFTACITDGNGLKDSVYS